MSAGLLAEAEPFMADGALVQLVGPLCDCGCRGVYVRSVRDGVFFVAVYITKAPRAVKDLYAALLAERQIEVAR